MARQIRSCKRAFKSFRGSGNRHPTHIFKVEMCGNRQFKRNFKRRRVNGRSIDDLIMDSINASPLVAANESGGSGQDRISGLPDPILPYILSFLPFRETVQSSVLGKRWRNQWASMQWLEFNCFQFDDIEKFVRFVDVVLILRNPLNVDTFCLNFDDCIDQNQAKRWIVYAINHNVRVLSLNITYDVELPRCLTTCWSLEELFVSFSINYRYRIPQLSFAEFSRLKRLYFSTVNFSHYTLENLISGCPMIEDLHLRNCMLGWYLLYIGDNMPCLYISSQTMKNLTIKYCRVESGIQFSIPSLVSLHYEDSNITQASFANLTSLVYAFISDKGGDRSRQPIRVNKLMKGLSNAKILKLFGSWIELVLENELPQLPTLHILERLTLGMCRITNNFGALAQFLQHSPNLEYLTLKEPIGPVSWTSDPQSVRKLVNLSFDCPHLKIIEIQCYKKNARVLDLVKTLLLENSRALHRIIITPEFTVSMLTSIRETATVTSSVLL